MSIPQQTIARLRMLRLNAIADAYERQLEQPNLHELSFDERFGSIVEQAAAQKESKRLKGLVTKAQFWEPASIEEIDFGAGRGLDKQYVLSLGNCEWVRRKQNILLMGATGVGKTWLSCALGHQACRLGLPTFFRKAIDLCSDIANAEMDGSLKSLKSKLIKPDLLILDDLGIGEFSATAATFLLDVVDRRMKKGSLMITSQFTTDMWHSFFPNPTVADALLDRVIHQSHRLHLKGESMRKILARGKMADDT